jgi:hypothetical protein
MRDSKRYRANTTGVQPTWLEKGCIILYAIVSNLEHENYRKIRKLCYTPLWISVIFASESEKYNHIIDIQIELFENATNFKC